MYENAQLRSDFRKKISPWLRLEPIKMITLEQGIIPKGQLISKANSKLFI